MSAHPGGLDRLEILLAGIAQESYADAALKLAERFDSELTAAEARVYDDALLRLARAEKSTVRVQISQRLAPIEAGPERTVTDLAYDLDPEVAAPVLRQSVLLKETDLITIARTRSQEHLGALAERSAVSAPVTDVVAERGSWPVLRKLSANTSAALSRQGLSRLLMLAREDGHITVSLAKRSDVPAATRGELLQQFKDRAAARHAPLSAAPVCGPVADTVPADDGAADGSARASSHADPFSPEGLRAAAARVGKLAELRPLTAAEVSRALAHGRVVDAVVLIAWLADQEPERFVRGLWGLSPVRNFVLLAMRSIDLSWPTLERLVQEVRRVSPPSALPVLPNVERQREAYVALSCEAARQALAAMRGRADLLVIEGGRAE